MENYNINEKIEVHDGRRRFWRRASWGSIFAGVAIAIAVSMLLSLLGWAVGMFILDPTSSQPFSGVFGTIGIWSCVSMLIGLACGGFVAGKLAGKDGFIHGFVVWSVSMIMGFMFITSLTAGAVRLTGKAIGAAGNVVAGAGSAVGSGISALADEASNIFGDMDFNVDQEEMRSDVRQALRRSGVKEFQPEYLRGQYRGVSDDLKKTVKRVVANPKSAGDLINGFTDRLGKRIDAYAQNVNREDVVSLVANNSDLSRAQAEDTVDQYIDLLEQGREQMQQLQENVREAAREWEIRKQELMVEADKAANSAGWMGVIFFIALLLGAALSSFAGRMGMNKTQEGYEA